MAGLSIPLATAPVAARSQPVGGLFARDDHTTHYALVSTEPRARQADPQDAYNKLEDLRRTLARPVQSVAVSCPNDFTGFLLFCSAVGLGISSLSAGLSAALDLPLAVGPLACLLGASATAGVVTVAHKARKLLRDECRATERTRGLEKLETESIELMVQTLANQPSGLERTYRALRTLEVVEQCKGAAIANPRRDEQTDRVHALIDDAFRADAAIVLRVLALAPRVMGSAPEQLVDLVRQLGPEARKLLYYEVRRPSFAEYSQGPDRWSYGRLDALLKNEAHVYTENLELDSSAQAAVTYLTNELTTVASARLAVHGDGALRRAEHIAAGVERAGARAVIHGAPDAVWVCAYKGTVPESAFVRGHGRG